MKLVHKTLIAAGVVIIAAGATIGIFYFLSQTKQNNKQDDQSSVLDLSKDYGACSDLSLEDIKTTLGNYASNVQAGENMGIVGDTKDSDSQICVYAFEPGATLEDGFNSNSSLIIRKTKYTSDDYQVAYEQISQDPTLTDIGNLGTSAFYSSNTKAKGPDTTHKFVLYVFKDQAQTSYTISQPSDAATFDAESAQAVLESLARQSKDS